MPKVAPEPLSAWTIGTLVPPNAPMPMLAALALPASVTIASVTRHTLSFFMRRPPVQPIAAAQAPRPWGGEQLGRSKRRAQGPAPAWAAGSKCECFAACMRRLLEDPCRDDAGAAVASQQGGDVLERRRQVLRGPLQRAEQHDQELARVRAHRGASGVRGRCSERPV